MSVIFSSKSNDEVIQYLKEIFTVNGCLNKQNERVYATSRENANLHNVNILKV